MNKLHTLKNFITIDLETTGLSPRFGAMITEISAIKFIDGEIVSKFSTLVDPETRIPAHITRITKITNAMVAGKPTIGALKDLFKQFCEDYTLVAHNATFERLFLEHFDLLKPDYKLACSMRSYGKRIKLKDMCWHMDVDFDESKAHRAEYDCRVTAQCWKQFHDKEIKYV